GRRRGEVRSGAAVPGPGVTVWPGANWTRGAALGRRKQGGGGVLAGADPRRRARGLMRILAPSEQKHQFEEWQNFEPLIGHASSALLRGPFGRIRRLKAAQIADLLEEASKAEGTEILSQVHADP